MDTPDRTGYGEGYNTVLPRANGLSRRGLPDDTGGKKEERTRGDVGAEETNDEQTYGRTNGRTDGRTDGRMDPPWSCYGAGERRKRPVRLISAAGADKANVRPLSYNGGPSLGLRARESHPCVGREREES
ncbi:hypothetical protein ALC56_03450 [Trachymyrmex septentrionalis]|uniref:Uncharacterized protein n=1 Tax=Trachymyrmex septentrionalis TaxID=34720 RepID=A0A195FPS9_9HYME|nr:hypothetical protein ALC56_03450 [Trachymyrmex septentrionalis]